MKIQSTRLGQVEIDPARIITFPEGIIGFPDAIRFIELEFLEDSPLRLLQAVDNQDLGFVLIDPLLFMPGYVAETTADDLKSVHSANPDELLVRAIVTIPEDPYEMTANLQGPVVINPETRLAKQIINLNQSYTTKHKIISRRPDTAPAIK